MEKFIANGDLDLKDHLKYVTLKIKIRSCLSLLAGSVKRGFQGGDGMKVRKAAAEKTNSLSLRKIQSKLQKFHFD